MRTGGEPLGSPPVTSFGARREAPRATVACYPSILRSSAA
jgi:hypothetical protein